MHLWWFCRHAEMIRLARSMFQVADEDGSGKINKAEFIQWAKSHLLSNKLVRAFRRAKKLRAPSDDEVEHKLHGGKRAKSVRDMHVAHSNKAREDARRARVARKRKAKLLTTIASGKAMEELTRLTAFDIGEIKRLRQVFASVLEGRLWLWRDGV